MLLKKKLFKSTISILLVLLLAISCLPITVSAANLKIVDIEVEPITIVEYTEGYYSTQNNIEYFYYEPEYIMEYTVTFSDGTVIEDYSYNFYHNDEYYYFDTYTGQSYKNQWKAGNTYTMKVSIDNISVDVPVTIAKSPIKSIEIEPITIFEYSNGYYNEDYDEKIDDWVSYYYYTPQDELEYTVTFTDGTTINENGSYFEYKDEEYYLYADTNQSYENQWTAGNTYNMEVSIFGYNINVPVTIAETSIKSIEIEPITVIEYTNGYYEKDYYPKDDYNDYSPLYYYYSPYNQISYTITLKDGTIISDRNDCFEYGDEYYSFDIITNQSYENRWLTGNTYTAEIELGKYSVDVPVTIIDSPIVSIEAQPIYIMEGFDGYFTKEYDEYDEVIGEYFLYQPEYCLEYTITFNDGTVVEDYNKWFDYNGETYSFISETDQSFNNQWVAGNTYTMTAEVMGYSIEVPVTITECPFKSIEIEPIYIIEGTEGHTISTYEDDEFIGDYYEYDPEYLLTYTITLKDGTVIEDYSQWFEYNGEEYELDIDTDQDYDNQWTVGNTYTMEVTLGKLKVDVPVTITPSPVKSINIKPITLIELTDGNYNTEYNPETDDYDLEYFEYDCDNIEYTVTLKDGTIITGTDEYVEIDDKSYWFEFFSDQSYNNQWKAGNTYKMKATLMGVSTEFDVNIIDTPIKDIIVEPIAIFKDIDSYVDTEYNPETDEFDLEYDYYSYENFVNFTILWKDGTTSKHSSYDNITFNNRDYYCSTYDNQSYDTPWKVGNTYNASLTVLGKTVDIPVTIKPSPIKSVEFIKTPDKKDYTLGEVIDLKGSVIRVNYTDNTYEDVKLTYSDIYYQIYLKRFDRYFFMNSSLNTTDIHTKSTSVYFLSHELQTNISVKNKSIDSISLRGSGIDLTMEITYSDRTKQTAKVLDLNARYGDGEVDTLIRGGSIITDKGIFNGQITENTTTGDFDLKLFLYIDEEEKIIKSNTVSAKQCNWWKLQNKIYTLMPSITKYSGNITSYNGNVTAENIDELLSIVCSANNLHFYSENYTGVNANRYTFYADKVKAAFNEVVGFTPNLSLSRNYNAKNNTITVDLSVFSNPIYQHPVQIVQTNNSIKVTTECNVYGSVPSPITITFDKNLNLTAFDYSGTEEKVLTGDVNNDGIINVIDATEIQKYLAGLVNFDNTMMKAADYNGDSTVSIIDATDIQKMLAGLI